MSPNYTSLSHTRLVVLSTSNYTLTSNLLGMQIRRAIIEKGVWKVVLPGLSSVQEVKDDVEKEREVVGAL